MELSAVAKAMAIDLLSWNPALTGDQAFEYVAKILAAEQEEDYVRMYAVLQLAIYGPQERAA